jgi:HD superfamily phosphohydrolase
MFSHVFEEVGNELNLPLARHEMVSDQLIRDGEISTALEELGSGFACDVAQVISGGKPGNLYDSVVSSQFDADRLDYMQRDRMMTGVESSGIDATWLLANLEVASVPTRADCGTLGHVETLVVGPKAFRAAENYVLSLFQLYPNVYFHKATRAAEKTFACLMIRLLELVRGGHQDKTGLPNRHPLLRFAQDPERLDNAVQLDDAVFWGALPMIVDAQDSIIVEHARQLWFRRLPKCFDIRRHFEAEIPPIRDADQKERVERKAEIDRHCNDFISAFSEWSETRSERAARIFIDQKSRTPYKKFEQSQSLLNQILIRSGKDYLDMAQISPVVASAETFDVCRVYIGDGEAECEVRRLLNNVGSL